MVRIYFSQGTLLLDAAESELAGLGGLARFDERVGRFRARACDYARIVLSLRRDKIDYEDHARNFKPLAFEAREVFSSMPHQEQALRAWEEGGRRGCVVMPTGSGKTYLAVLAILRTQRPALVMVPTIDLMQQWATQLERFFGCRVGMLGGGSRDLCELTVSTYDSAVLRMEFMGDRFGLFIFDECHHLPGAVTRNCALMGIAPFRLGLTATPERTDGGDSLLWELVGPLAYRIDIDELEGDVLSPYLTHTVELGLDPDEEEEYRASRECYTNFLRRNGISFRDSGDWGRFLGLCARLNGGREAFQAYLRQKRIARGGRSKLRKLWELIVAHRDERIIVFTAENAVAYEIGERFLLPVLTHKTRAAERKDMLGKFRSGVYPVLVTSNVLNEGVDVPEASVGIIISGSGSIREHVQRLGRILRSAEGKQAVLYELISQGTSEEHVSRRRRGHRAYMSKEEEC